MWGEKKKQQEATIRCLLSTSVSICFGHHYAIFRRTKTVCYCIRCTALVLLDVAGSGCGALLASYNAAPHNRYQPHPGEPAQYTLCNMFSWRWHNDARNILRQKLIINIWLLLLVGVFLSLHTLLTMHGHRNLKRFFLYLFIPVLYMFRSTKCLLSGESIVSIDLWYISLWKQLNGPKLQKFILK